MFIVKKSLGRLNLPDQKRQTKSAKGHAHDLYQTFNRSCWACFINRLCWGAPTVRLVCTADAFDDLCTARTQEQAEAFCGDPTKTTTTKAADCEDTITTACMNIRHTLCDGIQKYIDLRAQEDSECLMRTGSQAACDEEIRVDTCDADEFATGCVEQKYVTARRTACTNDNLATRCMATVTLVCGTNGEPLDAICVGIAAYYPAQKLACATGEDARGEPACAPTIMRICAANGTPFDTFCTGLPNTDDNRQTACESGDKTRSECVSTIARVCAADGTPFADLCTGTPNITATRATYCTTNGDEARCPNVNYGKWRDSFKGDKALPTAPANLNGNVDIGFLADLTTTTPVITGLTNNAYNPVTFADFNGGDARGGSVFWLGTWGDRNASPTIMQEFLTTTDVGAPLTSDLGGKWVGRFQSLILA